MLWHTRRARDTIPFVVDQHKIAIASSSTYEVNAMNVARLTFSIMAVGLLAANAGKLYSQDYPIKPIRIITGGATGASGLSSRFIAQGITPALGQTVVADYRG